MDEIDPVKPARGDAATRSAGDRRVVLLMAGGSGTRLWPLSRPGRAKQFASLTGGETMLESTYERVLGLVPPERIFVNVTQGSEHWVEKLLPKIPRANIISAPADRETLPTLGFATLAIERSVARPTMILLASDNWIGDTQGLVRSLEESATVAESGPYLVSVGIRPDHASTQYGYMQCGEHVFGEATFTGLAYHEKPDQARADAFFADGSYDWNSGMFVWTADAFWAAVRAHAKKDADVFDALREADPSDRDRVALLFSRLSRIAVDHGVLEHVGPHTEVQHRFVRSRVPWDDVGRFGALAKYLPEIASTNRGRGDVDLEGVTGSVVIAGEGKRIVVSALADIIVCADGDDVLVASRAADGRVRDLADAPAWPGVVPDGHGGLERSDVDGRGNQLEGFVKVLGASGCVVTGESRGITALVAVKNVRVEISSRAVRVSAQVVTTAASPRRDATSPRVFVDEDRAAMSRRVARDLVAALQAILRENPRPSIILSAGRTPELVYAALRGPLRESVDWSSMTLLQMDDYANMRGDDPASFSDFLRRELVVPLGIGTFAALDGTMSEKDLRAHEERARASGIDLVLHGIGENGHLGFNEPGAAFDSTARRAALAPETRAAAGSSAGAFGGIDKTPSHGLTLGLDVLTKARRVFVLASGEKKARAIGDAFLKQASVDVPASSLRGHPDVTLFLDREAARRFYA